MTPRTKDKLKASVAAGGEAEITERKRVEDALRTSEAILSNALKIARLGHWEYDVASDLFTFNDHFYAMLHTTADQVGGYTMSPAYYAQRFVHPDDIALVGIETRKALETTDPHYSSELEHRIIYADGEIGYITVRIFVVKDDQGRTIKTCGVNQDITKRKRAEETLRENEEKYKTLFNSAGDAVFIMTHTIFLECNIQTEKMFGCTKDQMIGHSPVEYSPEKQPDGSFSKHAAAKKIEAAFAGEPQTFEWLHTRLDGTPFYAEVNLKRVHIGEGHVLQAVVRDITDRKQAEDALADSEKKFRWLFDYAPVPYHVLTPEGVIADVNIQWCETLGYSKDEVLGRPIFDFILESERSMAKARFEKKKLDKALMTGRNERTYVAKDGTIRTFLVSDLVTLDKQERVTSVQTTMEDITERKRVEDALRTSEAILSNALKIARLGHWEYDVASDLFTFNDHFYAMLRTTADQVGGYTMSPAHYAQRFVHPDDLAVVGIETRKALETTDPHYSRELEHRIIYADGEIGYIGVRIFIVKDDQGRTIKTCGVNQDITERKRAEEEILRQLAELRRWQDVTLGREDRIQHLKSEVNELLNRLGEAIRYPSQENARNEQEAGKE